ncbi:MAG: peptidoglycan-binding domain-containing protein, partial [Phormidesmis sp.]
MATFVAGPSICSEGRQAIAQTPSALIAQTSPEAELYIGSRGVAVRTLQEQLKERGLYEGPQDGIFGLSTQAALLAFQSEANIKPTGRSGETTRQALRLALAAAESDTESNSASVSEFDISKSSANASGVSDTVINEIPDEDKNSQAKKETRLVKLLMVGLGLFTVVGSFGVGFLVASRGKQGTDLPPVASWPAMPDEIGSDAIDPSIA